MSRRLLLPVLWLLLAAVGVASSVSLATTGAIRAGLIGGHALHFPIATAFEMNATDDNNLSFGVSPAVSQINDISGNARHLVQASGPAQADRVLGTSAPTNVSAASWAASVVTFTTAAASGVSEGNSFTVTGVSPAGYNGTYTAVNGTNGTTLKAALVADPGAYVSGGSVTGSSGINNVQVVYFGAARLDAYNMNSGTTWAQNQPGLWACDVTYFPSLALTNRVFAIPAPTSGNWFTMQVTTSGFITTGTKRLGSDSNINTESQVAKFTAGLQHFWCVTVNYQTATITWFVDDTSEQATVGRTAGIWTSGRGNTENNPSASAPNFGRSGATGTEMKMARLKMGTGVLTRTDYDAMRAAFIAQFATPQRTVSVSSAGVGDNRIYQRDGSGNATATFTGKVSVGADAAIEMRFLDQVTGATVVDWATVATSSGGAWTTSAITLPSGSVVGWARKVGEANYNAVPAPYITGVGDLYLSIGLSTKRKWWGNDCREAPFSSAATTITAPATGATLNGRRFSGHGWYDPTQTLASSINGIGTDEPQTSAYVSNPPTQQGVGGNGTAEFMSRWWTRRSYPVGQLAYAIGGSGVAEWLPPSGTSAQTITNAVWSGGRVTFTTAADTGLTAAGATQTITAASWAGNFVTFTTGGPHGVTVGQSFRIQGVTPAGYDDTYVATTGTTGNTLKGITATDPGAYVSGGTAMPLGGNFNVTGATPSALNGVYQATAVGGTTVVADLAADPGAYVSGGTLSPVGANWANLLSTIGRTGGPGWSFKGVSISDGYAEANAGTSGASYKTSAFALAAQIRAAASKTPAELPIFIQPMGPTLEAASDDAARDIRQAQQELINGTPITTASWAAGEVTFTSASTTGAVVGQSFTVTGVTPGGYNGTYTAIAGTTGAVVKAALVSDPGAYVSGGILAPAHNINFGWSILDKALLDGQHPVCSAYPDAAAPRFEQTLAKFDALGGVNYSGAGPRFTSVTAAAGNNFVDVIPTHSGAGATALRDTSNNASGCQLSQFGGIQRSISAASWSAGTVTFTTSNSTNVEVGQTFVVTGVTPSAYDGTYVATTGTTGNTLKAALVSDPGAYTSGGTATPSRQAVKVNGAGRNMTAACITAGTGVRLTFDGAALSAGQTVDVCHQCTKAPPLGNIVFDNAALKVVAQPTAGWLSGTAPRRRPPTRRTTRPTERRYARRHAATTTRRAA